MYEETFQNTGLKSEYRARLADALKKAKNYHGKQSEYEDVMKALIGLENWMKEVFGFEMGSRMPDGIESDVLKNWHPAGTRRKIGNLLEFMHERYERYLSKSDQTDLLTVESDNIILPPDYERAGITPGKGGGVEDPRFQERIRQLLLLLEQNGIYSDDIVLIRGKVTDNMMRKESYVIVEIPKLNREILICDQVGEATFVIYGIQGRKHLALKSKDDLQNELGARITKIVYREEAQWEEEVIQTLFKAVDLNELKKVDVRTLEGLRTEILKQKPTPEEWADMTQKEKSQFKVSGIGLRAIATKFDIEGNPIYNHKFHLELGRKIYGEEHKCLKYEEKPDLTLDEIKEEILRQKPTPEEWANVKRKGKKSFKISGMGLVAIAKRFGIEDNPIGNYNSHLELGRKIYGEEHKCLQCEEKSKYPKLDAVQIKEEILKLKSTPEPWADMDYREKPLFKISGMGLIAIAKRFGIEGDPIGNRKFHLELGRKIYGEGHECLKEFTNDQFVVKIKELKSTPQEWANMTIKEKLSFKTFDIGLRAIATRFGIEGNPIYNRKFHLELGRKIYGEEHECFKTK
jgi:hypothetical protein